MRWPPRNKKQAGKFKTDQELTDLVWREFPLYFANFDAAAAGYVDTLRAEPINADTLKLFNDEIFPNFDLRDSLPKITATTLVITGDDDFICGPVCAEEICASIRGARMVVVGDAGHMLFVEQPQAFHDAMTAFLEESCRRESDAGGTVCRAGAFAPNVFGRFEHTVLGSVLTTWAEFAPFSA